MFRPSDALDADGPRVGVRNLDVLVEQVDVLRHDVGQRIVRRGRKRRGPQPGAVPEEHRDSPAVVVEIPQVGAAIRVLDRDTRVGAVLAGEVVHAVAIERTRVARADDHLRTGDGAHQPGAAVDRPRKPDARREVVVVHVVGVRSLGEVDELRVLARHVARLEEIAGGVGIHARYAAQVCERGGRIAVIERIERVLQLVAQPRVDGQVRPPAPRILDEEPGLPHSRPLRAGTHVAVLVRVLVQPRVPVDLVHPPREERVEALCGRQIRRGGAREIRGREHGLGGIRREHAEADRRQERRVLHPEIVLRPGSAHAEAVAALQPGQRILDEHVRGVTRLRGRGCGGIGQRLNRRCRSPG